MCADGGTLVRPTVLSTNKKPLSTLCIIQWEVLWFVIGGLVVRRRWDFGRAYCIATNQYEAFIHIMCNPMGSVLVCDWWVGCAQTVGLWSGLLYRQPLHLPGHRGRQRLHPPRHHHRQEVCVTFLKRQPFEVLAFWFCFLVSFLPQSNNVKCVVLLWLQN